MTVFTSEPRKAFNPIKLYIIGIIVVVLGLSLLFGIRHCGALRKSGVSIVEVPGLLLPGDENFEYYKKKIIIKNLTLQQMVTINSSNNVNVAGDLVNDGDRKLVAVRVHVALRDKDGNLVKERTAYALRPGLGIKPGPMEPLETRQFAIGIDRVDVSAVDVDKTAWEITGLKYQSHDE